MDISEILKLSPEQQITALKAAKTVATPDKDALAKQWNPRKHDVFDTTLRPDKRVRKATGETGADGRPVMAEGYEPVNRIAVPFQRIIVNRAVGFLLGNPVIVKSYIDDDNPQQVTLAKMVGNMTTNKSLFGRNWHALKASASGKLWYPSNPSFWHRRSTMPRACSLSSVSSFSARPTATHCIRHSMIPEIWLPSPVRTRRWTVRIR